MNLTHISLGKAEPLKANPEVTTGIYKRPVEGAVRVGRLGIEGDTICDLKHHGGLDQAVYIYTQPDYDWWSKTLDYTIPPGTFGENLTIDGLESAGVLVGDRFRIADCVLEVTSPRVPCANFALRMTGAHFLKEFVAGGRPGVYCRVIEEGTIRSGDEVLHTVFDGPALSIGEMFADRYSKNLPEDQMRKYLEVPVHLGWRAEMVQALAGK